MRHISVLILLLAAGAPAIAQQEETFTAIEPGVESLDPSTLIPLADRGDVRAINNLGLLWARGVGVEAPNYQEAMRWWKEAAKRGYAVSMNNLGLLYASGHGVKQDYAQAMKWWEMAAEHGSAWAMNSIGDLYENGHGVEQSYFEALKWYERGAEGGDGLAMYNLGNFYEDGLGVERNVSTAMGWYERSADTGVALSMHRLGRLIAEGRGVPPDPAEGHAWLTLAERYFTGEFAEAAQENRNALAALAPKLDAQQLARSQEIAKNLQERIEERRQMKNNQRRDREA
jgi:TPR repeat protein